ALYSEMHVRQGRVDGYVKPIFRDLKILEASNEHEGLGQKIYEGIVAGAGKILTNPPRDQIATKTDLSGPLAEPHTSILQIAGNLVRNAFFKAILPGLERGGRGGLRPVDAPAVLGHTGPHRGGPEARFRPAAATEAPPEGRVA